MHVLDQVYFSPVLQRKFKALARLKRRRHKLGCKSTNFQRATGGNGERGPSSPNEIVNEKLTGSDIIKRSQITAKMSVPSAESEIDQKAMDLRPRVMIPFRSANSNRPVSETRKRNTCPQKRENLKY